MKAVSAMEFVAGASSAGLIGLIGMQGRHLMHESDDVPEKILAGSIVVGGLLAPFIAGARHVPGSRPAPTPPVGRNALSWGLMAGSGIMAAITGAMEFDII